MLLAHPLIIKRVGAVVTPARKCQAPPPCARSGRAMRRLRSAAETPYAWLWDDKTLADATLLLHVAGKPAGAASPAALRVHRAVLAAHSERFRTIALGWADGSSQRAADFQPSTAVAHYKKTGSLPAGLTAHQLAQASVAAEKEAEKKDDAYALSRLPALDWFEIPGAFSATVAQAAYCGFGMTGVADTIEAPAAWSAAPRKPLDPAELLRRTTIRWDVPRQQLVDLLASKDLTAKVCSEPIYSAGAGWRVCVDLQESGVDVQKRSPWWRYRVREHAPGMDEPGLYLSCCGQLVTYAECDGYSLGAPLQYSTAINYAIMKGRDMPSRGDWTFAWVEDERGHSSVDEAIKTAAEDGHMHHLSLPSGAQGPAHSGALLVFEAALGAPRMLHCAHVGCVLSVCADNSTCLHRGGEMLRLVGCVGLAFFVCLSILLMHGHMSSAFLRLGTAMYASHPVQVKGEVRRSQRPDNHPPVIGGPRSKNYLTLSGAQCLPKDTHLNSCDFATCEARRSSTLRHTVVAGTCNAQQQSENVLLLACGRDDDWIPLLAFGAAAGASALPAALLRLTRCQLLLRGSSCGELPTDVGAHVAL
ncbi:hypothetical protein HaLaN_02815, partial [Haematococcus lacustris]